MRPRRRLLLTLAALALAAGCRGERERASLPVDTAVVTDQRRFEPRREGRDPATVEDPAWSDTLADSPHTALVLLADSVAGHRLFHRNGQCMTCHGDEAAGLPNLGPELRSGRWLHIDGSISSIVQVIRDGIARPREAAIAMPAMGARLREEEIYRIAAYVHSLSHPGSVVADTTTLLPDPPFPDDTFQFQHR